MNFFKIKNFLGSRKTDRGLVLTLSFLTATLTSIFLNYCNSEFGGAKNDSQFYLNMFEYIRNNKSIIPLSSYEVSSSPLFVHVLGFALLLFGSFAGLILSLAFIAMTIASVYYFERLIQSAHLDKKIFLSIIFCGSGYLVAPMLHPTSESPMFLFLILSLYSYSTSKRKLLAFSLFCLVSVRQSLGWLVVVFIVWDTYILLKSHKLDFKELTLTYIWSFLSLISTFLYFDNRLVPDLYIEVQPENVFNLPNFLSVIQIGVSYLAILLPLLFLGSGRLQIDKGSGFLILYFSSMSFAAFVFSQTNPIGEGLGYLSLLHVKFDFDLEHLAAISALGFLILLHLAQKLNDNDKKFLYLYLLGFVTSSLVMPIPYLRYFQIPLILAVALIYKDPRSTDRAGNILVRIGVAATLIVTNLGSIAL